MLTDWGEYSIFVEVKYNENNEKLDFLRQVRYEIRVNNVYLKENNRPKSFDDIFKLTAYEDLGKSKKEKIKKYVKPSQKLIESAKKYGINIVG